MAFALNLMPLLCLACPCHLPPTHHIPYVMLCRTIEDRKKAQELLQVTRSSKCTQSNLAHRVTRHTSHVTRHTSHLTRPSHLRSTGRALRIHDSLGRGSSPHPSPATGSDFCIFKFVSLLEFLSTLLKFLRHSARDAVARL